MSNRSSKKSKSAKSSKKSSSKKPRTKANSIELTEEDCMDSDGRHVCSDCGKSYKQMSSLQRHIKKTHTLETTKCHECEYCNASFFSKYQLTVHKLSK